jgi:hypothetical protein
LGLSCEHDDDDDDDDDDDTHAGPEVYELLIKHCQLNGVVITGA